MLRIDKVIKPWKEAASLNAHINLYGFWNDTAFLTKSGDVGTPRTSAGIVRP
jgi:type IV secretion system protein VirB4